jgi:predicted DNA-binding protein (UPF0251 family)/predicted Fe-Mo cluster-binding NifX family protein
MARPSKWRCVECRAGDRGFGPVGIPLRRLERVRLTLDEMEALRLLHLEGATQEEAACKLGVSRSTVSRTAARAHRAITEAILLGKALCIEGGPVTVTRVHVWSRQQAGAPVPSAPKGENMVIAVPYLEGQVNAHFGSTQAFLVAEAEGGQVTRTTLYEVEGMQHNHSGIAGFLQTQHVEVILAGGMGAPMQQALKQAGFALYCGVSGPVDEVLQAFLHGEIEHSEATCGHHHGEL